MFVRPWRGLSLACLSFSMLAIAASASAQTKVAVVNLQRAVLESAEIKHASAQMEAKYKPRQAQLEKLQQEIQSIAQKLQTDANKLTPAAQADLNAEGQKKQRDFQRMQEDLQADVQRDRQEILQKSTQRMGDVVKKVAEEKSIDMVVDTSNAIFFKPALDITTEVLTAYDKAYPAPAAAAPAK